MKSSIALALLLIGFAAPSFAQQPAAPQTPATMPATAQPSPTAQPATAQQPVPPMQQPGVAVPEQGTASLASTELGTAALLVDRALSVLDQAANSKTGDVTLDRGLVDEVRAELSQVKATLQAQKK